MPNRYFDTQFYFDNNNDVLIAGQNPLLHYHMFGWREGRDPSPDFHTRFYLDANPDVKALNIDPLEHFLRRGRSEGRLPHPISKESHSV